MEIGVKIKQLRQQRGLTQEELASRTELTKGFISQLERDLTSPSIATLMDILEALGTDWPASSANRRTSPPCTAPRICLSRKKRTGIRSSGS